jgi:hypothetical protein
MTPEEALKFRAKHLIEQGCSIEDAVKQAFSEFGFLADKADMLLNIKHQIEWELKFGK